MIKSYTVWIASFPSLRPAFHPLQNCKRQKDEQGPGNETILFGCRLLLSLMSVFHYVGVQIPSGRCSKVGST